MKVKELAERIELELKGIAEEDLTTAEKNILRIIEKFLTKKKGNQNAKN